MKDWLRKNGINILIAGLIAIPISIYAISQQRQPVVNKDTEAIEAATELESETQTTETGSEVTIEPMDSITVTEPEEPKLTSLGEFKLSAYCSCEICCKQWANVRPKDENGNSIVYGASGERLEPLRSIAVDTSVIPYGTEIMIYDKVFIAQDTGSSIKGNHIDVYMECHEDACAFGLQYAEVFLVEEE